MDLLLDTQAWLWLASGERKLAGRARRLVEDRANAVYLSSASVWEVAIKRSRGKLELEGPLEEVIPQVLAAQGVLELPVRHVHALRVASLPWLHHDPFDRLLVAQALEEDLALVSADPRLAAYGVRVIRA